MIWRDGSFIERDVYKRQAILRGSVTPQGKNVSNYHYENLVSLYEYYSKKNLQNLALIVDTNHSNSGKNYLEQIRIAKDVIHSRNQNLSLIHILILGSGGTSKTARYVAADLGAEKIYIASRHENNEDSRFITYDEIEKIADSVDVLINTTPLGMYPKPEGKAADVKVFKNLGCVIDVVYNPLRTKLVLEAKEMGIPAEGGLYMLVSQAVKAIEHFRDCEISDDVKEKAFKNVLKKRQNIVFTGMPGSGKTVIGKLVADVYKRQGDNRRGAGKDNKTGWRQHTQRCRAV